MSSKDATFLAEFPVDSFMVFSCIYDLMIFSYIIALKLSIPDTYQKPLFQCKHILHLSYIQIQITEPQSHENKTHEKRFHMKKHMHEETTVEPLRTPLLSGH